MASLANARVPVLTVSGLVKRDKFVRNISGNKRGANDAGVLAVGVHQVNGAGVGDFVDILSSFGLGPKGRTQLSCQISQLSQ